MPADIDPNLLSNLARHVDVLAGLIGPRHLTLPTSFAAAASYVERELGSAGYAVARQTYEINGADVHNFVAELPGGRRKDELVILGAHYDTVPNSPGADDNASAVAVLIEAARRLRECQLSRTVRFVAFACEESPYCHTSNMGSFVHARACRERGEQIRGMLCLEMVGYYVSGPGSQRIPPSIPRAFHWALPHEGNFLGAISNLQSLRLLWQFRRGFKRATRLPLLSLALPESVAEIRRSDNSSFWDQGYPALMLTDTSFLRNLHYHLPSDTPDTLDYERMAQVTMGVIGGLMHVAG